MDVRLQINKNIVFWSADIFLAFSNCLDSDEMQHYAAFHQDLHCLLKYQLRDFPNAKG